MHLRRWCIAVELAQQGVAVPSGPIGQVGDEGLDLAFGGVSKGWGSAVVSGIGLHEGGVKLVLTDQQAETIAKARLTIVTAIGAGSGRCRSVLTINVGAGSAGRPTELLDRAEPDPIGFSESTVDGSDLFAMLASASVDRGRYVGWIGVAVADESFGARRFIDGRTEDPAPGSGVRQFLLDYCSDPQTVSALGYVEQTPVRYVPSAI